MSDDRIVVLGAGVAKLDQARIDVTEQLRLAQLVGAHCGDEPMGEFVTSTSVCGAAEAAVVVEAITEVVELKSTVLGELSAVVRSGTPLVSTTSSIPIGELAELLVCRRIWWVSIEPAVSHRDGRGDPGSAHCGDHDGGGHLAAGRSRPEGGCCR
ncbi:MAG: 3-hydroxyacyl-CoA dehydrogenase NAD-binding domain-containing protein [Pseudonocardiaceae bacterium]